MRAPRLQRAAEAKHANKDDATTATTTPEAPARPPKIANYEPTPQHVADARTDDVTTMTRLQAAQAPLHQLVVASQPERGAEAQHAHCHR